MVKEQYFPGLEEINNPLSDKELSNLHAEFVNEGQFVSQQTKFNYAWGLVKSDKVPDQLLGVQLFTELFKTNHARRAECLYYLSLGSFKLGDYSNARKYSDRLLEVEPNNSQAVQLRQMIEDKLSQEGLMGIAIIGGALAIGIALVSTVMRHRR